MATGVLVSAVYSVSDHPREVGIAILLSIPTILTAWTNLFAPSRSIFLVQLGSIVIFLVYALLVILRRVMQARDVTPNEIYRAVSVYIMIGLAYAFVYQFIEVIFPSSFSYGQGGPSFSSIVYFSFVSLATVGFGDITAITPLTRSISVVEMITGVMYLAVFIGVLVNAHYRLRYETAHGEPVSKRTRSAPGFFRSGGPLALILIGVLLNLASSFTMISLHIPLFLDTWGTSLAVIRSGFPAGAATGIVYNLILAFAIRTPVSAIWSAGSVLVAAATWVFWRRGWIDLRRPGLILAAGILTGLANGLFGIALTAVFGLPPYAGTMVVSRYLTDLTANPALASVIEEFAVELMDKTLSLFLAAVAILILFGSAEPRPGDR